MKMKRLGNRGASVAMVWVYVIESVFAVGFIYMILDNLIRVTLYNQAVTLGVDSTLLSTVLYVWGILPFMWLGGTILYGIVYTIRRGGERDVF